MKMITDGLNKESMIFLKEIMNPTDNVEIQYLASTVDRQFQDKNGLGWISHVIANSTRPLHVLRHMIPFGFPVNLADNNGAMPLHYTVKHCKNDEDKLGLILILLANGAKVDAKTADESMTALMMACCLGDVQSAELLLARGASIHATDRYGNSCLHLAARHLRCQMVQFLLYRGLTANCRNVKSQSPSEVVGDAAAAKDVKKVKRIRRVLKENAVLQKQLAQNYKEKLRAERKERESLESLSTKSKWEFTCEEFLHSLEGILCGVGQAVKEDDFSDRSSSSQSSNSHTGLNTTRTSSSIVTTDPAKGFADFTRTLPLS